jgi:hypothetical protein
VPPYPPPSALAASDVGFAANENRYAKDLA